MNDEPHWEKENKDALSIWRFPIRRARAPTDLLAKTSGSAGLAEFDSSLVENEVRTTFLFEHSGSLRSAPVG